MEVLVLQLRALNEAVGNINESDLSVDIAEHFARALEMIYVSLGLAITESLTLASIMSCGSLSVR